MHTESRAGTSGSDSLSQVPDYVTPSQIARRMPPNRGDRPVHIATVIRYVTTGVALSDGSRLKLRAVRFPGGWRSTWPWVQEFIDRLTADRTGGAEPHHRPDKTARSRSVESAERYLAAAGF